ncbi:MAG: hypothetical protein MUE72_04830, partial [Chitinophagaceae bacterium]|nr:hypothetical protein [Chitinophagaceae bacterium]
MSFSQIHRFHIPVMGLAYTMDSPIKVAKYGIASVISIVEDNLIEMMRKHYCTVVHKDYIPITKEETDYRALRTTAYLNLVNEIVQNQVQDLKSSAFEKGTELVQYFEMLPNKHHLKKVYNSLNKITNTVEKSKIENYLRNALQAGSIDVNIMTKVDKNNSNNGVVLEDGSDAVAALRGYANSNLKNSAIVFSAGLNPRLYNYLEKCTAFEPNEDGSFDKRVIIKVSDYRSALIQGKYLAKKGIWVSEFRIESGLNCGGHAFATDGFLLGAILEEFKVKKDELIASLFEIYQVVIANKTGKQFFYAPAMSFSVQGGIGTYEEDDFLHEQYNIQSTGWGTPFLLVPEATTVDKATLDLLCAATTKDIELSNNSPLGVRFHYLKGTTAEQEKLQRIKNGKPGSPCAEKHLALNTEFTTEPICTASVKYQQLKIEDLQKQNLPQAEFQKQLQQVLAKECLCIGLSNSAAIQYNQSFVQKYTAVNICPGPNIVHFSSVVSLKKMVDHIYGRTNIIKASNRPHFFIAELKLYINYLQELLEEYNVQPDVKKDKYLANFVHNLKEGIEYYKKLAHQSIIKDEQFLTLLIEQEQILHELYYVEMAHE